MATTFQEFRTVSPPSVPDKSPRRRSIIADLSGSPLAASQHQHDRSIFPARIGTSPPSKLPTEPIVTSREIHANHAQYLDGIQGTGGVSTHQGMTVMPPPGTFVNYTAWRCAECDKIDSKKAIVGSRYSDEEAMSTLTTTEQCKCEGCVTNRDVVAKAGEDGSLVEAVKNGTIKRHPDSTLTETIIKTTIVREPKFEYIDIPPRMASLATLPDSEIEKVYNARVSGEMSREGSSGRKSMEGSSGRSSADFATHRRFKSESYGTPPRRSSLIPPPADAFSRMSVSPPSAKSDRFSKSHTLEELIATHKSAVTEAKRDSAQPGGPRPDGMTSQGVQVKFGGDQRDFLDYSE